jgi:hypothetical protein
MNSIIKMFGPSISDPSRIVNRDVPVCDELAYRAAGYKRGSIPEPVETPIAAEPTAAATPVEVQPEIPEPKPEIVKAPKPRKVVSK